MWHRMTAVRLTALGLLAALLLAADDGADTGPRLDDHGWWWAMQTGLIELPAPPSVPEDGLLVANGPEGPTAIAGIRYEIDDDVLDATLVLEIADEQGGEVATIRACTADARWRGAQAGTWEDRPSANCDEAEVTGQRDEGGETWRFDLMPLIGDGVADVILLPGPLQDPDEAGDGGPDGAPGGDDAPATPGAPAPDVGSEDEQESDGAPFQVAFEPPSDDSVEVTSGFGFGSSGDEPDASSLAGSDPGADSEPERPEPRSAGDLDMGSGPGPRASTDEPAGSARTPEVAGSAPPSSDEPVTLGGSQQDQRAADAVAMQPGSFGDDRIRQVAALVALIAGVGALVTWRVPTPLRSGLAGLRSSQIVRPEQVAKILPATTGGEAETRGLGRFRRPRDGDAPPLV